MNDVKRLKKDKLNDVLSRCLTAGKYVYGPVRNNDIVAFQAISSPSELTDDFIQTPQSAKFVLFPRVEELMRYSTGDDGQLHLEGRDLSGIPETVLFGVRPCDANGFRTLEAVFTWDEPDNFYITRRRKTTIISVACRKADQWCFCTSVGGGPADTRGSDIQLKPLDDGDYLADILTEKGHAFVSEFADLFESLPVDMPLPRPVLAEVPRRFDQEDLTANLATAFDSTIWNEQSLRCLGCGACAFLCPSCVCFDIQDEGTTADGKRLRCWDSCGFSLFTLHTSGHNPRDAQHQRWRQRIMHKFSYLPDRLSIQGCAGCGRCSRACPVDMDLAEHLAAIAEVSR